MLHHQLLLLLGKLKEIANSAMAVIAIFQLIETLFDLLVQGKGEMDTFWLVGKEGEDHTFLDDYPDLMQEPEFLNIILWRGKGTNAVLSHISVYIICQFKIVIIRI